MRRSQRDPMPRHTIWVSVAGLIAVVAYAALAAVQILVLNPLAAAPGLTLPEIHGEMAAVGESLGQERVLIILAAGVAMAVGVAAVSVGTKAPPIVPAMTLLALLMFGPVAYFVASFGAGMALADTFAISGADRSPWALPLYAVSALAALTVIIATIASVRRGSSASPGPRGATSQ